MHIYKDCLAMLFLVALLPLALASPIVLTVGSLYNDTLVRDKIFPMAAAAYSKAPIQCLNNKLPGSQLKRQLEVSCDFTRIDKCSGFTAISTTDKAIILSFRGTNSNLELLSEGDETLFMNHTAWVAGGKVSKFFYDGFNKLWNGGMKDDFLSYANKYPKYQLWVTGHSLGGAMASLAASFIAHNKLFNGKLITLMTFGQPRTGDKDWAAAHDKEVGVSFRVTHGHDIVPHLPLENQQGYYHHLTEVYYKKGMSPGSKYYVCSNMDESDFCSNGNVIPDANIKQHLHYFEKDVSEWGVAGCN